MSGRVVVGVYRQGLSKIFRAAIYRAHRAVVFAIAQLSCCYLGHTKNHDADDYYYYIHCSFSFYAVLCLLLCYYHGFWFHHHGDTQGPRVTLFRGQIFRDTGFDLRHRPTDSDHHMAVMTSCLTAAFTTSTCRPTWQRPRPCQPGYSDTAAGSIIYIYTPSLVPFFRVRTSFPLYDISCLL